MIIKIKILNVLKHLSLSFLTWLICFNYCCAQCLTHRQFWDALISIENTPYNTDKKLTEIIGLKNQFEKCGFKEDSVYARILHRIGALEYSNHEYNEAIKNTIAAIRINTSGKTGSCLSYAVNSYYNIGLCYYAASRYNEMLLYYDSLIIVGAHFPEAKKYIVRARLRRGGVYYKKGDFEKDIQETTLGLPVAEEIKDTSLIIGLLLERAQSYEMQQKLSDALKDINDAFFFLQNSDDYDSWSNAYRYKADILADQANYKEALDLYNKAIIFRTKTNDPEYIATDFNDAGYMLLYKCNNPDEAKKYFTNAYKISVQANADDVAALAIDNLAQAAFNAGNYKNALLQFQHSLQLLVPHYKLNDVTANPPYKELNSVEKKSFLEIVLDNKSKSLLYLYKQTLNRQLLKSSIATALLADSIITDLRHEQTGEQSKLYWRNDTRDFFTRSIEACYLDDNPALGFLFMEKSRAVLLNDKLNELGASAQLPDAKAKKEESLQINITIQQQKLSALNDTAKDYVLQQRRLLQATENFEHYIDSLQKTYPAYYQYKYADKVQSLKDLQQYLAKNNQSFVHYFIGDTVTYILAITAVNTKFIRLSQNEFNKKQLADFLQLCSNKEALNNHYDSFASLSNSIYKTIFQQLNLPKGRVVICTGDIIIPFDALCTDEKGSKFLLNDYAFDYVYSAGFLMKQFNNRAAEGNFLGFAPVSFDSSLHVAELKNAADALHASASYYNSDRLLTHENASKSNFFKYASSYSIVSIFSHARADTTDNEPVLFMQDSLIHLSELQLLNNPAAKLVLLSACQTNVGKAATGEGIYSLARGFAIAGIPSVAATLWNADEQTIYSISEKFNQYLSEGMNKDEALQKAKLYFIQNNSDKSLPYYWANMIVIGNTDAVKLSSPGNYVYLWLAIAVTALLLCLLFFWRRKSVAVNRNS